MMCVPFALSFVSGATPEEVLALLQEDGGYGRRKRTFPRSGYIPALKKLGVSVLATNHSPHVTVQTWVRDVAGPASTWIIRVSGHLMVSQGGKIFDNMDPTGSGASLKAMARCRVTHAWKVAA